MSTENDGARFFDDVDDGAPNTAKSIIFQIMTFPKPSEIKAFQKSTMQAPDKYSACTRNAPYKPRLLLVPYYLLPITFYPITVNTKNGGDGREEEHQNINNAFNRGDKEGVNTPWRTIA